MHGNTVHTHPSFKVKSKTTKEKANKNKLKKDECSHYINIVFLDKEISDTTYQ